MASITATLAFSPVICDVVLGNSELHPKVFLRPLCIVNAETVANFRRWKKDKLQVSYEILCASRLKFQIAAKMAKAAFLSKIILAYGHNPRTLFKFKYLLIQ